MKTLCGQVERDVEAGDFQSALETISFQGPAIWYGLRPERFRAILEAAMRSGATLSGLAEQVRLFVTAGDQTQFQSDVAWGLIDGQDSVLSSMGQIARMIDLRLRGHAHVASNFLEELHGQALAVHPLFDTRAGWQLLVSMQCGITSMLAGDFSQALSYFAAAESHVVVPTLVFLSRDAFVKSALVHAFFGDPLLARRALADAARFPRTISWTEPLIDCHAAIVEARLADDPVRAAEILESIPLRDLGEMWPFYVLALHHVIRRSEGGDRLKAHLSLIERLGFPRTEGEGFTGSVFPLVRASIGLQHDALETAEWFLAKADPEFFGTRLVRGSLALAQGRAKAAVALARKVDTEPSLRQKLIWRQAVLSQAFMRLGENEAALDAVRFAMSPEAGMSSEEAAWFSPGVRALANSEIPAWPDTELDPGAEPAAASPEGKQTRMTRKQREILRLLAAGASRTEIAAGMFISVNTVKSHMKALYKKLHVSSRHEAVARAELEGWL